MMRWLLDQAAERGEPVAILHASEGAIYPHFGFGLATLEGTFDMEQRAFRFAAAGRAARAGAARRRRRGDAAHPGRLRPASGSRRPARSAGAPPSGALQLLADDSWRAHGRLGPKFTAVLEVDGEARGYAIYRIKGDWGDRGPERAS